MTNSRTTETVRLGVARVMVDVALSHLDRPFDYAVTADQDAEAVPGARVRVRFAGQLRDGFMVERVARSEHQGTLAPLHAVISPEPVMTPEITRLIRRVADHYAGCFADVMRLAVPPRHTATEKAPRKSESAVTTLAELIVGPWSAYPAGAALIDALAAGRTPRAAWQLVPSADPRGDWAYGFAYAAQATVRSGRGVVIVVPDQADLRLLKEACTRVLGRSAFAVLTAEAGPAARYRAFLAAERGDVPVVIGNRAAAYAPVHKLGLVALLDDGNDLLSEPRAPYPHAREVLAMRAGQRPAAAIFAGFSRTAEVQLWLERGWLREVAADRAVLRQAAPRVHVSVDSDWSLRKDPSARAARIPHEVFDLVRSCLPQGPVLFQVPRSGYLVAFVCQACREPARCQYCAGPVGSGDRGGERLRSGTHRPGSPNTSTNGGLTCRWCGRPQVHWTCPVCGSGHLRAPIVGAERTAEELGRSFPHTRVVQSSAANRVDLVPDEPALVVATPGAEPPTPAGYAGAVLLDTGLLLLRADLRAAEEALRRWLAVVALVRSGSEGGSVLAVGESSDRALQALVRLDPAGFAQRELGERGEAHFPPAVKMVGVEGPLAALAEFTDILSGMSATDILGPVEMDARLNERGLPTDPLFRLMLRAPLPEGKALVAAVKQVLSIRSAKKSQHGALRVRVDPVAFG